MRGTPPAACGRRARHRNFLSRRPRLRGPHPPCLPWLRRQMATAGSYSVRPTFKEKFPPAEVKKIIGNYLAEFLADKSCASAAFGPRSSRPLTAAPALCRYNPELTAQWTREIADGIKGQIKLQLDLPRYKYVVQVVVGEQRGEGVRCVRSCSCHACQPRHPASTDRTPCRPGNAAWVAAAFGMRTQTTTPTNRTEMCVLPPPRAPPAARHASHLGLISASRIPIAVRRIRSSASQPCLRRTCTEEVACTGALGSVGALHQCAPQVEPSIHHCYPTVASMPAPPARLDADLYLWAHGPRPQCHSIPGLLESRRGHPSASRHSSDVQTAEVRETCCAVRLPVI